MDWQPIFVGFMLILTLVFVMVWDSRDPYDPCQFPDLCRREDGE